MGSNRKRSRRRILVILVAGLVGLCLLTTLVSALSNVGRPEATENPERLGELEQNRIAEAGHLRETLGDEVWPGWGEADIPFVIYNEAYAFLVGYPDPPQGWITVPGGEQRGAAWQEVAEGTVSGERYYRQALPASGETPQAFTVQVGERWATSMTTMAWMRIALGNEMRDAMPGPLGAIIPYRWLARTFVPSSEHYMAALAHESFHAFVGQRNPERLRQAEQINSEEGRYPLDDDEMVEAWKRELDTLADALLSDESVAARDLARQFLEQREKRRRQAGMDAQLIAYERQREWQEGLAKYVELESWRQAALTSDYEPWPGMVADPEFQAYAGYQEQWTREVAQVRRMAGDNGGVRFYYSGMAQAFLLDRLMPGWKESALDDGVFLEELLAEALE